MAAGIEDNPGPDHGGSYLQEKRFHWANSNFTTPQFRDLAERTRARWDLFDYVKTVISQRLRNRKRK